MAYIYHQCDTMTHSGYQDPSFNLLNLPPHNVTHSSH